MIGEFSGFWKDALEEYSLFQNQHSELIFSYMLLLFGHYYDHSSNGPIFLFSLGTPSDEWDTKEGGGY